MKQISQQESIAIVAALIVVAATFFGVFSNPFAQKEESGSRPKDAPLAIDTSNDPEGASRALADVMEADGTITDLVIEDTTVGTGREVRKGDTVTVHYVGVLQDGTRFDDSSARGEPFVFTVGTGAVIPGWDAGIIGMRVGGERVLVIPPSMAYGSRGIGVVPPDATLLFAIKLLDVK